MTEYIYGTDGREGHWLTGEEIVRCRDCKHVSHYWHHDCERWQCANEMLEGLDVYPSFYCAWGVKKEGGE